MIVPGGGISLDGTRWVRCKPGFLLPVRVLSHLFRRLFLAALANAHAAGRLAFFGKIQDLHCRQTFAARLAPLKRKRWFVYTKPPFAGPEAVLAYLARYTHRVAISNRRLIALDERGVTFRYKDYRRTGRPGIARSRSAPTSSSGASCCTFYQKGFIASAINHRMVRLFNVLNFRLLFSHKQYHNAASVPSFAGCAAGLAAKSTGRANPRGGTSPRTTDHPDLEKGAVRRPRMAL